VITFEIKRGALPDALYWDTEDPLSLCSPAGGRGNIDYVR
jgi:hypothetical protein